MMMPPTSDRPVEPIADVLAAAAEGYSKEYLKSIQQPSFRERSNKMVLELFSDLDKLSVVKKKCDGRNSFEEIFSSIWDLKEAHEILAAKLGPYGKSEILADMMRNEGNQYFRKQMYERALERYNFSIVVSPHPLLQETTKDLKNGNRIRTDMYCEDDREPEEVLSLAKGYANRSAVMLELHCYEKCLRDIDLALKSGYPKDRQSKLISRKQKCLAAQNGENLSLQMLSLLQNNTEASEVNPSGLKFGLEGNIYSKSEATVRRQLYTPVIPPPKINEPNPTMPSLSNCMKLTYTPTKGRGLVAKRHIRPGEILCVERAYAVSVEMTKISTYCSYCLKMSIDPLPCPGCAVVLFCSETCRTKALKEEHWIECKLLPTLVILDMTSVNLACKLLKCLSYNQMTNKFNQLQKEKYDRPEEAGLNTKGVYSPTSYRTIHNLMSHKEKFPFEELFRFCQLSFIVTKLLQQTERYFVDDHGEPFIPSRDDFLATGGLLISHFMKMDINACKTKDKKQDGVTVGNGIYPTLSLFNHSCNPATVQHISGRTVILSAKRPIRAGEEITIAYGCTFHDKELPERKAKLEKYFFTCTCIACKEHWPVSLLLPNSVLKCVKCSIPVDNEELICRKCRVDYSSTKYRGNKKLLVEEWKKRSLEVAVALQKAYDLHNSIEENKFDVDKELEPLCRAIMLVHKNTVMPCQAITFVESVLIEFFEAELYKCGQPLLAGGEITNEKVIKHSKKEKMINSKESQVKV